MHNIPVSQIPDSVPYDAVVMNHVLEHVNDPIEFLKDVRRRLRVGGIVHIAVPNIASWEALLSGWNSFEPYHLVYFSPFTLRLAVEQAGLNVLRIGTHDSFSGWFLALFRTLLKPKNYTNSKHQFTSGKSTKLSWVNHAYRSTMILSGMFTLPIRLLQGAIGRGDELVIIAQYK